MSDRRHEVYGFKGAPEGKIEQEFESLHSGKLDIPLDKRVELEKATAAPEGKPVLRKISEVWCLCVRIENDWYKLPMTKV